MARNSFDVWHDNSDGRRGPFDPDPEAKAELWFLPPVDVADDSLPGRQAKPHRLFDPLPWKAAQHRQSGPLAELAALFGALDERLRAGPDGWGHRLALMEVVGLGWWTGDHIPMDRLALWVGLRAGATGEDAQALIRAGWAARRLTDGPAPDQNGWEVGLKAFLGRSGQGNAVSEAVSDLADIMSDAAFLHPVTQAAILYHGWRMLGHEKADQGQSGHGPAVDVEAAVLAVRHAARTGRGAARFLPVALTASGALRAGGSEDKRLEAWIAGAMQATLAALLHLDRLRAWETLARSATAGMSGRTPPALISALVDWPILSAPLAEEMTGASRAAVQRNLDTLTTRGLIREVTGQGRFRVWTAKV